MYRKVMHIILVCTISPDNYFLSYLQSLGKYYLADTGIRFAVLGKRNMDLGVCLKTLFI